MKFDESEKVKICATSVAFDSLEELVYSAKWAMFCSALFNLNFTMSHANIDGAYVCIAIFPFKQAELVDRLIAPTLQYGTKIFVHPTIIYEAAVKHMLLGQRGIWFELPTVVRN